MRIVFGILALVLAALPARAENFTNLGNGQQSPGSVLLCQTSGTQYLPCSSTTPLPTTMTAGSAVNINDGSGNPLSSTNISSAYRLNVQALGTVQNGATAATYIQEVGGTDGTLARALSTDTSGRLILGAGTNAIGGVYQAPNATSAAGIAPSATSALAGSLVLKASAGNLYGLTVTTSSVAGYVLLFNASSAPADGAVTPTKCIYLGAAPATVAISWRSGPAAYYSTGITVVFSTTGCFTKTASATAFIDGDIQ